MARSTSPSPSTSTRSESPVDHLPRLQSSYSQDVFDSVYSGRKSHKTLRGGEKVWPPVLEAALIEGLERYQPSDSRETRLLGRYPLRNRFISDYILHKTGHSRTPKQVGSRLQQLRESGGGKWLQRLLRPLPSAVRSTTSPTFNNGASSSGSSLGSSRQVSQHVVWIDVLPDVSHTLHTSSIEHASTEICPHRYLRNIDPTLTFIYATATISARSDYQVFITGGALVHEESTMLTLLQDSPDCPLPEDVSGRFLYTTTLVPNFWETICQDQNPTQYTIIQTISTTEESPIYSAKYCIRYPKDGQNPQRSDTSSSYPSASPHSGSKMDINDMRAPSSTDNHCSQQLYSFPRDTLTNSDDMTPGIWETSGVYDITSGSGSDGYSTETDHLSPSASSSASGEEQGTRLMSTGGFVPSQTMCFPNNLSSYL